MLDGPVVAAIVLAGGAVIVGGYFYVEHLRHGRSDRRVARSTERLPLFGIGAADTGTGGDTSRPPTRMPRPDLGRRPGATSYGAPAWSAETSSTPTQSREQGVPSLNGRANGAHHPSPNPSSTRYADGQTLRFALPDAGTLQFLPGRLQVVVGPESGREIRFVRSPNSPDTDVSFGRSEGPPHRHVQLLVPTVSRRHAVMSLLDEHWSLQNLSATNPVTLNGRPLAPDETVPLLVDGDRIEMGEVVFVFHGR